MRSRLLVSLWVHAGWNDILTEKGRRQNVRKDLILLLFCLGLIFQKPNDIERINVIQNEIDKLRMNPNNQNVVRDLHNQLAFLIRKARRLPRMYQTDERFVKG